MVTFLIFALGGLIYGLLEILWRGFTHWTMLILGGLCSAMGYAVSGLHINFPKKLLLCTTIITTLEFFAGVIVNIIFRWQVWDYSSQPLNILGQICPRYCLLWGLLSAVGLPLCSRLRRLPGRRPA